MPTGSKLTPTFMLSVVPGPKASTSRTVSIVERQLWTFTLKRNGPFGDEHVPDTYARLPRTTIDRKSTRSELQSQSNLVCRLLLEKKKLMPAVGRLTDRFALRRCRGVPTVILHPRAL